jgi:uncharacterized DUF497 family protein
MPAPIDIYTGIPYMPTRQFEWDDAKAASNFAKHAVEFDFAIRVFLDPLRADFDVSRAADSEERRKAVGDVDGEIFTVVYTMGVRSLE